MPGYACAQMPGLGSAAVPAVRADDHARGDAASPLVVVYGDFTCPRCAVAWERLAGEPVRLVFRHFALKAKHPRAVALAHAAEAAGRQGAFWPWAEATYGEQGRLDDPHLWARAERLGLDLDRFEADRRHPDVAARVAADVRDALRAGATATPTVFVDGVGHPGPPEPALLERLRAAAAR
jgi:protein-disulfide isomerase